LNDKHTEFRHQKDKYHRILAIEDMVVYSTYSGPELGCVIGFTARQVRVLKMVSLDLAREFNIDSLITKPQKGILTYSKTIIKINIDFM